jgi:hypothetical protein
MIMKARNFTMLLVALLVTVATARADEGKIQLQRYFNDVAAKVKATPDPTQKRQMLSNAFERVSGALEKASALAPESDNAGIQSLANSVRAKHDELVGQNGFERVPDAQLDQFADYTVQEMEQADKYVTISLTTLLLIAILVILLAR